MRKTMLITVLAVLCTVPGFSAENRSDSKLVPEIFTKADPSKISPFCKAILQGDIETVKRLIALGVDVNEKSLGKTPAIFAARYNKADILSVLLENGADLTIRCDDGYTAKKYAELSNAKDALAVINAYLER
ncbi:MAG TPA: ankyrin repeat domain-containing protein [Arenibacter sp.]|nr:ankyrin repeat domain-containing protein [Arenibacter sp.]